MMTAPTVDRNPPLSPLLPEASIVVGGRSYPAQICAAAFQGGVLETLAQIEKGSWVPLKLFGATAPATTLHIHVLEADDGKLVFRLYGTDSTARRIWEQLVVKLRESQGES